MLVDKNVVDVRLIVNPFMCIIVVLYILGCGNGYGEIGRQTGKERCGEGVHKVNTEWNIERGIHGRKICGGYAELV